MCSVLKLYFPLFIYKMFAPIAIQRTHLLGRFQLYADTSDGESQAKKNPLIPLVVVMSLMNDV